MNTCLDLQDWCSCRGFNNRNAILSTDAAVRQLTSKRSASLGKKRKKKVLETEKKSSPPRWSRGEINESRRQTAAATLSEIWLSFRARG